MVTLLIALSLWFSDAVGLTIDERDEARYGRRIWSWYLSGFHDRRVLGGGTIEVHGGLFDMFAQLALRLLHSDEYATRHALSGLCAVLGIVAAWRIAARIGGARAGLSASVLLSLTPVWAGHALFNPKDIPFAAAAAWSLYGAMRLATPARRSTWRIGVMSGLATGAALGVRPTALFLLSYPLIAVALRLDHARQCDPATRWRAADVGPVGLSWCIAWLTMLIAWPWGQVAPFWRVFEAVRSASNFRWGGQVLFDGRFVAASALPHSYLPTWFAVTLPDQYFLAAACLVPLLRRTRSRRNPRFPAIMLLLIATFGPFVAAVVLRPVMYDAHRHFLFLVPPLAALCGLAVSEFAQSSTVPGPHRWGVVVVFGLLSALTLRDMVALHPYEYVYFNRLAGGLPHAYQRFETDYWGASYGEGIDWVVRNVPAQAGSPLRVASCNDGDELVYYLGRSQRAAGRFQYEPRSENAEIFLATTRNDCHRSAGEVIHVIERQGVPLLYVLRRQPSWLRSKLASSRVGAARHMLGPPSIRPVER